MTRNDLIEAILHNPSDWSCPGTCEVCSEDPEEIFAKCKECADKMLAEYEANIKSEAYDEAFNVVLGETEKVTNFADMVGIKILKMKKKLLDENKNVEF